MDLIPGIFCAAHFTVRAKASADQVTQVELSIRGGQAMQRFWLTATRLGLAMQPSLAPFAFAHLNRQESDFVTDDRSAAQSARLASLIDCKAQGSATRVLFSGRVGSPKSPKIVSRSIRWHLNDLLHRAGPF